MIMGNLPLNDIPTKVLFDTGASHCFISRPFASKHELFFQDFPRPLSVVFSEFIHEHEHGGSGCLHQDGQV